MSFTKYPKVSIITVSYNCEEFIEETIKSVISQDYPNIEYIIIDGGSSDGTVDIIKRYDKYINFWISEPDNGMYEAINKGMKHITGELWMCLNSDDCYATNNVITKVIEKYLFSKKKYGIYYGNIITQYATKKIKKRVFNVNYSLLLSSRHCTFLPQPASFLKTSIIYEVGYFDTKYKCAADYDYFLRCLKKVKAKYINYDITIFRIHESQITNNLSKNMNIERERIINHYSKNKSFVKIYYKILMILGWSIYLTKNMKRIIK